MLAEYPAKILIVDDIETNIRLLKHLLSKTHDVHQATHGNAAMEMIMEQAFDLVLLDVMMPDIDGFQVLDFIREHFDAQQLPVIMVSALDDVQSIAAGLEHGANDYITKPINPLILQTRVKTQLRQKFISDERNRLIDRLEKANITQTHLMRIASHDLKNPLHNIMMAHELISPALEHDIESQELLDMANQSAMSMLQIVEEFLGLDVLRGDKIDLTLEPNRISATLSDVMMNYRNAADKKAIHVDLDLDDLAVVADEKRLRQVLDNLVSNAIKYTPIGGQVKVAVKRLDDDVVVHVIDSGAGIPKEEQANLFEPFTQISTTPTNGEHSTGLGLWIAKQMIELQGGQIGLDSPSAGGCDFWIRLPLVRQADRRRIML